MIVCLYSNEVFSVYKFYEIVPGCCPHPGDIVESGSLAVCVASVHVSFHYKLDCWGIGQYKQMQLQPVCLSVAVQRNFFSRITSVQQSRFVSGLSRLPCAAITIHFIVSLSTLQLGAEEAVHEVCVSKTTDPIIVTSSKDGVCIHSTPAAQMVVSGHASQ